jgi:tRNA threonylcarbamoyl adenosine modification protein YeaZ
MSFLSIDSSNGYSNVLITDENCNKVSESVSGFHEKHSVLIFKQINGVMREAGIKFSGLSGIAVILGPGSYTGIRVSLTIAKTLAYVLGINIRGIESLAVCAYSMDKNSRGGKNIIAVKDAPKGSYYVSEFLSGKTGFDRHIKKISLLNSGEIKRLADNGQNKPSIVYGYNEENDMERFKDEFRNTDIDPAFFDLKQTAYFASMMAFGSEAEKKLPYDSKYAEELSPYYIYGDGPF